jgi:DNA-binding NtrC family response regulator
MERRHPGYDVLIVDDDRDIREMVATLLRRRFDNINVVVAANGADAIEKMRAGFRPTFVLTDVNMPHLDGLALREWLQHVHPGTAVVGMSAAPGAEDQFDGFLAKPFQFGDLTTCVSRWVRVHERSGVP